MLLENELTSLNASIVLPWNTAEYSPPSYTSRVIYTTMLCDEIHGRVKLTRAQSADTPSFYGVIGMQVPKEHVHTFEAGHVPSPFSQTEKGKKSTINRKWKSTGFIVTRTRTGDLCFTYDHTTFVRFDNQKTTRYEKRKMIRDKAAQDDHTDNDSE